MKCIPGENLMSEISSVRSFVKTFVFKVFASTIMKLPVGKGKHIIFYFGDKNTALLSVLIGCKL